MLVKKRTFECAIASQTSRYCAMSASASLRRGSSDGNSALLRVPERVLSRTIWMSAPSIIPQAASGFDIVSRNGTCLKMTIDRAALGGGPPLMVTGSLSSVRPKRDVDARKPPMLGGAGAEAAPGTSPQMPRGSAFRATAGDAEGCSGAAVDPSAAAARQASRRSPTRSVRPAGAR